MNPYNYGGKLIINFYDEDNMFNLDEMDDEDLDYMISDIAEGLEPYGIYISDGVISATTRLVKGIFAYQAILDYSEVDDHRESYSPNKFKQILKSVFSAYDLKVLDYSLQ